MSKLKRVGIFSLGKVMGMAGLIFGLLAALFYGFIFFVLGASSSQPPDVFGASAAGAVMIVALPLLYGFGGFITGLIYACITNIVLSASGGLELEIE